MYMAEQVFEVNYKGKVYFIKELTGVIRYASARSYQPNQKFKYDNYIGKRLVGTGYQVKKGREQRWVDLAIELQDGELVDLKLEGCHNVPFNLNRPVSLFLASSNNNIFHQMKAYFHDNEENWTLQQSIEQSLHPVRTFFTYLLLSIFLIAGIWGGYEIGDDQNSFWVGLLSGVFITLIPSAIIYALFFWNPMNAAEKIESELKRVAQEKEFKVV